MLYLSGLNYCKGWYAGGTVFKVVKIEDNKVYTEEDKKAAP